MAELEKLVAQLLERLGRNSTNSSMPPSSDGPEAPEKESKPSTGRKPGGQPGHKGRRKDLLEPEKVGKVVSLKARECRVCQALLLGDDPSPARHQVLDLVDFKAVVVEYQLHTLQCLSCSSHTTAAWPEGVSRTAYGPRLMATISLLTGVYRLSKRLAVRLLADLLGVKISLGALSACEAQVSTVLQRPAEDALAFAQGQPVKQADETSWKEGKARSKVWLWVVCTMQVTVFLIRPSRATEVAKELLGEHSGILVTDRLGSYGWWPVHWRQLCWAHIKRHFQKFIDAGGEAAQIGEALQAHRRKLFKWWRRVRDGNLSRHRFRQYVSGLRKRVKALLVEGSTCSHDKTAGTCTELLKLEPALWTFVRYEGVEPTNNRSEQSLRTAVIWRKLSFGTHSTSGSRFVERMLTVVTTLRQQKRNVLDYLTAAIQATLDNSSVPSLLPKSVLA